MLRLMCLDQLENKRYVRTPPTTSTTTATHRHNNNTVMAASIAGRAIGVIIGIVAYLFVLPLSPILDQTRLAGIVPAMHTFSSFGFSERDIPDLKGKLYVVTGANSGLGFGATKLLVSHGATVVMTCRSVQKCNEAKATIASETKTPESSTIVMELDNASLKSVKQFVRAFRAKDLKINGLILNAGGIVEKFKLTADNLEQMFGVNHLAHFAITKDLLDLMTEPSTIVSVTSIGHFSTVSGGVFLDEKLINDPAQFNPLSSYGQSKLCNILLIKELNRRLGPNKRILANAVHPGAITGNFNKPFMGWSTFLSALDDGLQSIVYWSEEQGALSVVGPAVSPKIIQDNVRGEYFVPIARVSHSSAYANDAELAKKLWEFSERLLAEKGYDKM